MAKFEVSGLPSFASGRRKATVSEETEVVTLTVEEATMYNSIYVKHTGRAA